MNFTLLKVKNDFITLNEMLKRFKRIRKVYTILDKLTFFRILLIWSVIVFFFGMLYFFLATDSSFLIYSRTGKAVHSLSDAIYFSFITATSTGFGDIIPAGTFKMVSIMEVIFGLLLLAVVTSKFISLKQDVIMGELYEITFHERFSKLRSSLLLFRENLNRIGGKIDDNSVRKREISDLYLHLAGLESTVNDIMAFVGRHKKTRFSQSLDSLNTELLFNSLIKSFEKLDELIHSLNTGKIEWKRDITVDIISRSLDVNDALFEKLGAMKILSDKTIAEFVAQKNRIRDSLRAALQ